MLIGLRPDGVRQYGICYFLKSAPAFSLPDEMAFYKNERFNFNHRLIISTFVLSKINNEILSVDRSKFIRITATFFKLAPYNKLSEHGMA